MFYAMRISEHRDGDDLLTGGPRAWTDCAAPWRRRSPTRPIPRRRTAPPRDLEQLARHRRPGARRRLRHVVRQRRYGARARVPVAGDGAGRDAAASRAGAGAGRVRPVPRCMVVTASSGSRGIYGAIAVAGAWGLPKGCAVAYTDKGAGTDYFDLDAGHGRGHRRHRAGAGAAGIRARADRRSRRRLQARAFARQPRGRLGPARAAGGANSPCRRSTTRSRRRRRSPSPTRA